MKDINGCEACFCCSTSVGTQKHIRKDMFLLTGDARKWKKLVPRRRRAVIVPLQCKQTSGEGASQLDGELRDLFDRSIRDVPVDEQELRESDRRVMEGITETGASRMNEIVSDMKDNLKSVEDEATKRASEMIKEETDALLSKYEDKRSDLLAQVQKDRQVIQEEFTKIEQLAGNMKERSADGEQSLKTKVLFVSTVAFVVATLYYAWNGFVNSDSSALTNAAVDALVAAAAGYFLSRE